MIEKPAKYLDKILNILAEDFGKSFSTQDIQNKITPIDLFGMSGNIKFSPDLLIDLQFAIEYLVKQNFVFINQSDGKIFISFEGYMKIKTKSFNKEINEKSINQTLQRIAWLIPIFISILALIISLSKDSSQLNNKSNINKTECLKKNIITVLGSVPSLCAVTMRHNNNLK
ncbi:hypothetical protein [Flavobacterium sp. PS2]|uniref:hypothetical protein n=1 Tax=Flavobacterium sp. PS2 TaxID=3384157 RepID=UPI00390CC03A